MTLAFNLMIAQVLLGAFDNLWHHEATERLPSRYSAVQELRLHALREAIYAGLFVALAWYEWHGFWTLLIAAMLLAETLVTLADFLVEDRTRRLPSLERILHTVLAVNYGALLAVLLPVLTRWWYAPSGVTPQHYGALSSLFTLAAAGVLCCSVRNGLAVLNLTRPPEWVRRPLTVRHPAVYRTVLVSGATGFIGGHLVRRLLARGDRVIVLTRDADRALNRFGPHVRIVTDLESLGPQERIDAIVNLAGAPILALPWTARRRRLLLSSRIDTTRGLMDLAARLERVPRVLLSASAIGYYGIHADEVVDEHSAPGAGFQSALCRAWEEAALPAEALGIRLVRLRIGVVLDRDGGALPRQTLPLRLFAGAILGSGHQWVSWIHLEDLLRLIEFALDRPLTRGIYNAVAPAPVTHQAFQRQLGRQLRRPVWLRVPGSLLRAALGEMSQLLVEGQRVLPNRVVATGFQYHYPQLPKALRQLLGPRLGEPDQSAAVYFNGHCPVCSTEMQHYAGVCKRAQLAFTFVDSSRADNDFADSGLRREHLERRVYLRREGGEWLSGMPALVALWRNLPGYVGLARLVSLPGIWQGAEMLYDHVLAPALACWAARRVRNLAAKPSLATRRELV